MDVQLDNHIVTDIGTLYHAEKLPLILQHAELTPETMNRWLGKRLIPVNREGLAEAKRMHGRFENFRNMFSLTDQYWFKRSAKDSWDRLNFFTHPYHTAVGEVQFTPWSVDRALLKEQSPDLSTNGVVRKMWVQGEDMDSYLIKAGSETFHQEPLSEILATEILKRLKLVPIVEYEFCVTGYRMCSMCKNFVTKDTEFVPAQHIFMKEPRLKTDSKYTHFVKMCKKYGIHHADKYLDKMILSDMVIGNEDRHFGNFGLLRDVISGQFLGFAPLFDFGSSFWEYNPDREKTAAAKAFADQEDRVMLKYGYRISNQILEEFETLFYLIDTYPALTIAQKEAVKAGIRARHARFTSPPPYKKEELLELDTTL